MFKSLKGLFGKGAASGDRRDLAPPADVLASAEAGDAEAANEIGLWYSSNQPESREMERWFRRAADAGFARAQHNMGVIAQRSGRPQESIDWFRRAIGGGWRNSIAALAAMLEEQGDKAGAIETFKIAAEEGDVLAQDALGRIAFEADTEDLHELALYWSEKAAKQGDADAQARLGMIFNEGRGVERDTQKAAWWWLQAAQQDHAAAQAMLGAVCHLGIGVEANRLLAARWLRRSAAQGNFLGRSYLQRVERELTADERAILAEEEAEEQNARRALD